MTPIGARPGTAPLVPVPPEPGPAGAGGGQVIGATIHQRLRSWRPGLLALLALLVLVILAQALKPPESTEPLAIDNPHSNGAKALTALVGEWGVEVDAVSTARAAREASAEGATVVLINAGRLSDEERERLASAGGDVVVLGALDNNLGGLTELTPSGVSAAPGATVSAQCGDVDAQAAGTIPAGRGSVGLGGAEGATGCFPVADGMYGYATAPLPSGGTLRVLAWPDTAMNSQLTNQGNAALAIRAIGVSKRVVWYDAAQARSRSIWDEPSMPRFLPVVLVQLTIAALALAIVQGRRFGRVVVEDLPAVVRSTETTIGRGRLYRRARDRGRAATALRAGTALRLGKRLGLPTGAGRGELIDALCRDGRLRPADVDRILYGPTPPDDRSLSDLAAQLDRLESEVHSS
ncbi:hypothetical protein GCM10011612_05840 [Actinomyces gaoshouyii]|uniref:DUF4350 domain-containing protein n=1 Tax=Actinomyces gaoshouyii TaxID=1960083 RepID=A0A8H9LIF8_9ACTO|nr:hypothetical protein GCM10011612_05840 [Actinomyces gaoshouyii]